MRIRIDNKSALRNPKSALTICATCAFLAQAALPPLPRLILDSFPADARETISRAYRDATTRPADVAAVGTLARTLHAWEQWNAAHETYARTQALAPTTFDWLYLDAVVLRRLARHADSAARLEQAMCIQPGYLAARVMFAEELFEAGDLDRSAQLFEPLGREPAAEPAAELGLGRIAAAAGRHDVAVTHLQRAVTLFPEFGSAYYALALSYRALGRADEARRALEQHAQYGPRWPAIDDPVLASVTALRNDPQTDLQRGLKLAEAGDLAGAIAAHEAALARDRRRAGTRQPDLVLGRHRATGRKPRSTTARSSRSASISAMRTTITASSSTCRPSGTRRRRLPRRLP